ncbi:LytR/AlgR family response regulator transcription factor [Flavihumibacter profundi]|jgi:DNA-binding LytR/AlgR family response regulator|uniref:LytR/AlgR family response regulator transcription factor n=1 Tax=Flavihumibacter profundi TaxID=2716883 RepID=UPI001CC5F49A|nr:LytTR family DNA-binding domain-containing protein [Flavihumibacter profundi]MBZ5855634.1 LytTR family DNA-binding domain-containing protein [Flavihumibacter profundi]
MIIQCIAVDDEALSLDLLVDNIRQVPFLKLVGTAKNALEVINLLKEKTIDLIFLDIMMPGLSGMQLAANLKGKTKIIFLTAYNNFALESYTVQAIDYLLKPVSFERFLEASMKALDTFTVRSTTPPDATLKPSDNQKYLYVNVEYNMVKIEVSDIFMVEGFKDYVKIHIQSQKRPVIARISLKLLEEKLMPFDFLRIHKSYIVALNRIDAIHKSFVKLGELEIPVSGHYKEELMHRISYYNIL